MKIIRRGAGGAAGGEGGAAVGVGGAAVVEEWRCGCC